MTKSEIMKTAWKIAKKASLEFGVSIRTYLSESLKLAWELAKKGILSIQRRTKKALLMSLDGVTFWIQKRWLRANKTLTPKAIESFEKAKKTASGELKREIRYNLVKLSDIDHETDRAVFVSDFNGNQMWVPKSQIYGIGSTSKSEGLYITNWFCKKTGLSSKRNAYIYV